jgi:hypothetical protein
MRINRWITTTSNFGLLLKKCEFLEDLINSKFEKPISDW